MNTSYSLNLICDTRKHKIEIHYKVDLDIEITGNRFKLFYKEPEIDVFVQLPDDKCEKVLRKIIKILKLPNDKIEIDIFEKLNFVYDIKI